MDEELKNLTRENIELSKENNKLLNELVSYQRLSRWLSVAKWIIIIGSTVGALYYLQPMLDGALNYYKTLLDMVSETSVSTLPGQ